MTGQKRGAEAIDEAHSSSNHKQMRVTRHEESDETIEEFKFQFNLDFLDQEVFCNTVQSPPSKTKARDKLNPQPRVAPLSDYTSCDWTLDLRSFDEFEDNHEPCALRGLPDGLDLTSQGTEDSAWLRALLADPLGEQDPEKREFQQESELKTPIGSSNNGVQTPQTQSRHILLEPANDYQSLTEFGEGDPLTLESTSADFAGVSDPTGNVPLTTPALEAFFSRAMPLEIAPLTRNLSTANETPMAVISNAVPLRSTFRPGPYRPNVAPNGSDPPLIRDLPPASPHDHSWFAQIIHYTQQASQRKNHWRWITVDMNICYKAVDPNGEGLLRIQLAPSNMSKLAQAVRFAQRPDQVNHGWRLRDVDCIYRMLNCA